MDNGLKEQLMSSFFRVKKIGSSMPQMLDSHISKHNINIGELALMKLIKENSAHSNENIRISDIQKELFITKAAISQMLGALERKGYICRETDKGNRRTLIVTLTSAGKEILAPLEDGFDRLLSAIIALMGEEDTKLLILLISRFADATEKLKNTLLVKEE